MPYVGILGGTFDPIHLGHLAIAQGAIHLAGLDRVLFLPNHTPPHKMDKQVTPAAHRAAMVKLAIEGNACLEFSAVELERSGPSYTIDTVRELRAAHPDWRLAIVIGMDSLLAIQTWRDYQILLKITEVIAVSRPGFSEERRDAIFAQLPSALCSCIQVFEIPGVDISGTQLRRLALEGYPLRYLVPDAVERYICEHSLYRFSERGDDHE